MKTTTIRMLMQLAAMLGATAFTASPVSAAEKPASEEVESVTYSKGVLVAVIDGKSIEVTNDVSLPKEIVVGTNGIFQVAGGKERTLAEGQVLSRDGRLTSADGSVVPVDDHVTSKGGRIFLIQDGEARPLISMTQCSDGTRIFPDGRMVTPLNVTRRLLDGQIARLKESGVESTDTARLEKGQVVLFKDGGRIQLKPGQTMSMSDGSRINALGTIVKRDGSRVSLKEGELYKFAGAGDGR